MEACKNCKSTETVKNGLIRQNRVLLVYHAVTTLCTVMNARKKSKELKRITNVFLYSIGKASFRFLAKLFNVSPNPHKYLIPPLMCL